MKYYLPMLACLLLITACGGKRSKEAVDKQVHSTPVLYFDITESVKERPLSDTVQMGRIKAGETVKNTVALINSAESPMVAMSVELSCGCTRVEFDRHPIQPADTLRLTFEFDSRGFKGFQHKTIKVNTSLSPNPCTVVLLGEVL